MVKRFLLKITSNVLLVCMILLLFTGNVFALSGGSVTEPEEQSKESYATEDVSLVDEILEPIIVSEDITKRGENEKHFLCDDGSYIAVSYPAPVHQLVDGKWVDVEYKVIDDGSDIFPAATDDIKVKFAKNTNSAKLVKLETSDYKVSWTVEAENQYGDSIEPVKLSKESKVALKTNKDITKENNEKIKNNAKYDYSQVHSYKQIAETVLKKLALTKTANPEKAEEVVSANTKIETYNREQIQSVSYAQSNVEYVGAFGEGTTLRYIMSPGRINEEVVLKSYNGFKSYSMVIDTDGLIPVKTISGRVDLTDKDGKIIMTIAAPFMYDSANAMSRVVEVTITQDSKKEWRITYTPDQKWLTDENRVYPVVIDPTVTTEDYSSSYQYDVYVRSRQNGESNDGEYYLYAGYSSEGELYISYWGIDSLPEIDSNATVTGTGLHMRLVDDTNAIQPIGLYVAYSADDDNFVLNTSGMTWSNKPSSGQFLDNQTSIPSDLWVKFASSSFGEIINNKYASANQSVSFVIKNTGAAEKTTLNSFYSSDYPETAYRPYLSVRYTTDFYNMPEGVYYIMNSNSSKYLTVNNDNTVVQHSFGNLPTQKWEVKSAGTGKYTISPLEPANKQLYCPDSGGVVVQNMADVSQTKWRFERCTDGTFFVSSMYRPWLALDVSGASTAAGATVYAFAHHGNTNQRWEFIPVGEVSVTRGIETEEIISLTELDISSLVYTGSPFCRSLVWSSTDPSVATVNSRSGLIVGCSQGVTTIRGTHSESGYIMVVLHIYVGYPPAFSELMNNGLIQYSDIQSTDDGFFMITKSISDLLGDSGIEELVDLSGKEYNRDLFYDDWYIYCIQNYFYSLYCMREQENDCAIDGESDGDQPAVKISMVSFDVDCLLNCLNEGSNTRKNELRVAINRTTQDIVSHNNSIQQYFADSSSCGAYLISREYVNFISKIAEGNVISGPEELESIKNAYNSIDVVIKNRAARIIDALNAINNEAGKTVYDFSQNHINVVNKNNLTSYEQRAILTAYCANVNYYSFAAEVEFHAEGLVDVFWSAERYYNSCLRASMAIDDVLKDSSVESWINGWFEDYWDLNSELVQNQMAEHGGMVN